MPRPAPKTIPVLVALVALALAPAGALARKKSSSGGAWSALTRQNALPLSDLRASPSPDDVAGELGGRFVVSASGRGGNGGTGGEGLAFGGDGGNGGDGLSSVAFDCANVNPDAGELGAAFLCTSQAVFGASGSVVSQGTLHFKDGVLAGASVPVTGRVGAYGGSGGDDHPTEEISLNFSKLDGFIRYRRV